MKDCDALRLEDIRWFIFWTGIAGVVVGTSPIASALKDMGQATLYPVLFDLLDLMDDNGLFDDLINTYCYFDVDVLNVFVYTSLSILFLIATACSVSFIPLSKEFL